MRKTNARRHDNNMSMRQRSYDDEICIICLLSMKKEKNSNANENQHHRFENIIENYRKRYDDVAHDFIYRVVMSISNHRILEN